MILNPEKMQGVVVSRKPSFKLSLFAEGIALPLVDTVDLFGLTLDNSLNFGKHNSKFLRESWKATRRYL